MNNALEKIKKSLGVEEEKLIIMTVINNDNGIIDLEGNGKRQKMAGNYQAGTQLIIKNGVIQSVFTPSHIVIYE